MLNKIYRAIILIMVIHSLMGCCSKINNLDIKAKIHNNYVTENDCIQLDLIFDLGINEKLDFNGFVLLKFNNNEGKVEFVDIHRPPYKMADWIPGSQIQYSRCIEVPENIPEGEYKITLGILDSSLRSKKIKINNKLLKSNEYYVGSVNVIKAVYYLGSYTLEWEQKLCDDTSFTWLSKKAKLYLTNPRKKIFMVLDLKAPSAYFGGDYQETRIYVNKKYIGKVVFDSNNLVEKKYKISRKHLGSKKFIEIEFESEKEFSPKNLGIGEDKRLLALSIYRVSFEDVDNIVKNDR